MSQSTIALAVENLNYSYSSHWTYRRSPGLKNVSFSIEAGQAFGFLGHNGAGKTTTIKCILGLVRASSGKIEIFGEDAARASSRRSLGYLPEQPYFYDHLSVQELLELYATLAGVAKAKRRALIRQALERTHAAELARSPMRSLSKGLTQRVALAQAIVAQPRLLILDEPFSGLDPMGRKEFADIFFALKKEGTTIMMSSHVLSDVEHICDRASILVRGQIQGIFDLRNMPAEFSQTTYELSLINVGNLTERLLTDCTQQIRQGDLLRLQYPNRKRAEEALATALACGVQVESFQTTRSSLQDVFVKVTAAAHEQLSRSKE